MDCSPETTVSRNGNSASEMRQVALCQSREGGASGHSFRCLLEGRSEAWHDTVMAENLWASTLQCMLKRGTWKLCHYPRQQPQLFNLKDDPQESNDRAADPNCREILNVMMRDLLANWDYDAITAQLKISRAVEGWTQQWWAQCDLPEPDAPWCEEPPLNLLETMQKLSK